ncbi:MAG: DUF2065 domain-containing protein [Kangiella sp.]|nr:DUF2065 domain-containing protein [Kangiella sp.]
MSQEFMIALGLLLVFEGFMPAVMPKAWKRMMWEVMKRPDTSVRIGGFLTMLAGLIWVMWVL